MHTVLVILTATTSVVGMYGPGQLAHRESADAHQLTAATAVDLVPLPLRAFLETNRASFRQCALSATATLSGDERQSGDLNRHYVLLDIAASADDPAARNAAAGQFPHERAKARELYAKHGVNTGGWLPWVIQEQYGKLVRAFKTFDPEQIAREAGVLLHFATDAALPFNTTSRPAGTKQDDAASPGSASSRLRQRFHGDLVQRLRTRFDYEVRVSPKRLADVPDVLDAVFAVLIDAHRASGRLIAIDQGIVAQLGLADVDAFVASSDLYFARLTEAAAPVLETQIEAGALLGASLITAAWTEAGRPTPGALTEDQPTEKTAAAKPVAQDQEATTTEPAFVGTRNSTTYHRASCSHAARIKPQNRVHFTSVDEARKMGRKPCKSCKPE